MKINCTKPSGFQPLGVNYKFFLHKAPPTVILAVEGQFAKKNCKQPPPIAKRAFGSMSGPGPGRAWARLLYRPTRARAKVGLQRTLRGPRPAPHSLMPMPTQARVYLVHACPGTSRTNQAASRPFSLLAIPTRYKDNFAFLKYRVSISVRKFSTLCSFSFLVDIKVLFHRKIFNDLLTP